MESQSKIREMRRNRVEWSGKGHLVVVMTIFYLIHGLFMYIVYLKKIGPYVWKAKFRYEHLKNVRVGGR